jgi:hypothetical protein
MELVRRKESRRRKHRRDSCLWRSWMCSLLFAGSLVLNYLRGLRSSVSYPYTKGAVHGKIWGIGVAYPYRMEGHIVAWGCAIELVAGFKVYPVNILRLILSIIMELYVDSHMRTILMVSDFRVSRNNNNRPIARVEHADAAGEERLIILRG